MPQMARAEMSCARSYSCAPSYAPVQRSVQLIEGVDEFCELVEVEIGRAASDGYIDKLHALRVRLRAGEETEDDKRMLRGIIEVEIACNRDTARQRELYQELGGKLRERFSEAEIEMAINDGTHYLCEFCSLRFSCAEVKNKLKCNKFDADFKD